MWAALAGIVLLASGCASTQPPSASAQVDTAFVPAQQSAHRASNLDELDRLLARLEQPDVRLASRKPSPGLFEQPVSARDDFVSQAMAYLGTRYLYGGDSPDVGFDCSGLIWFTARESLGVQLPRNAAGMAKEGQQVKRAELKRGDLVFFNTQGRRYSHVGIYVGNGRFLHAPSTGGHVRVDELGARYWNARYNGARRLAGLNGPVLADAIAPKQATKVAANQANRRTARR
ncbi:NlpC/P60 family protein [Verticiella sediminum]|uniref:NlpC/P60 family protein n=1 Tax=Verticiella sediminum TaxID=1247510 RepID=A0A556AIR4_9BURK|nr:C40 family peptidase [Verticiella sediminum]TSH92788.1 NlpC/P60 family protein [Verticiella sediminum]